MAFTWTPEDGTLAAADDAARSARYASPRNWIISGMSLSAGMGLNVAVSAGSAWIAGYYVEWDAATEQAVAASNTNHVFVELTRDMAGNVTGVAFVVNTTGAPPSGDYIKLGTATADGSGVTGTATTGRSPQTQGVTSVFGRDGAVVAAASDYDADQVDYDNGSSGLAATDVQDALDELAARPASGGWTAIAGITANVTRSNNTYTTVYSIGLEANKTYLFEMQIMVSGTASNGNMRVTLPSGATQASQARLGCNIENGAFGAGLQRSLTTVNLTTGLTTLLYTSDYATLVTIIGRITTSGTSGAMAVQFANGGSGNLIVRAGSNVKIKDVT